MSVAVAHPWVLALLLLALLPLFRSADCPLPYSWLQLLPRDPVSQWLGWLVRFAAMLALAAVVLGLAGLHRPAVAVERIGRGAEIVLLLDRSRSMDESFVARSQAETIMGTHSRRSKRHVARELLSRFVERRGQDLFGLLVFSTFPMRVLDLTSNQAAVQAAIRASDVGRGLGETDIGAALEAALSDFADRPYTGSRIIMLVSDGGAQLTPAVRERIADGLRRHRVALYWIYIRSPRSPGLMPESEVSDDIADTVPEHFLHKFFSSLETPYRAYQAENPQDLERAIADVGRLESLPIHLTEIVPPRDLAPWCYAAALPLVLLLIGAKAMEVRAWR